MPRNKKRIQIKKKSVKKTVVRHTQKTPEQKAKDNDILKLLLGRQIGGQAPVQQNQHTDEYRQKLEDYNKQLVEARREKDSLAAQVKQAKEEIAAETAASKHHSQEMSNLRQQQRHEEKKLRENERKSKEIEEEQRKLEKLKDANAEFDGRTKQHKHRESMLKIEGEQNDLRRQIMKNEQKIKEQEQTLEMNKALRAKKDLEETNNILRAQVEAKNNLLKSEEFKNADKQYQKVYEENLKLKIQNDKNDTLLKYMIERQKSTGEIEGMKQVMENYDKDEENKKKYIKDMTDAIVNETNLSIEHADLQGQIDNLINRKSLLRKQMNENENKLAQTKSLRNAIESKSYLQNVRIIEQQQQIVSQQQLSAEKQENIIANMKKIKDLEARNDFLSDFDPSAVNVEYVNAQLQEFTKQVGNIITEHNEVMNENIELQKARSDMLSTMENLLNKYGEAGLDRDTANQNLLAMITNKAKKSLPSDMTEYDLNAAKKATELMTMISSGNEEILTNGDSYNEFINTKEFKNFKWD